MKKRILAVLIVLAMLACFTACNQENNKEESSATSNTSETESKAADSDVSSEEQGESSYDLGDYIDQNIKNTNSYKKMMTVGNGDVIILATENYISEYYKFENGEIGVIDKSLEKDNEYTYLKYTDGNKMYTVDVNGKLYAETDISEDNSSDKEKFLTDLVNYLYYGLTYLGEKDGVEIYNVPSSDAGEAEYEDDETEGTDENASTKEVPENTTATSARAETETKTTDDVSVDSSEVITTIGATSDTDSSIAASTESSTDSSTDSSTEEASSEPDDLKRYIKITDTGIIIYDYLNGAKQSNIDVTIRKITDEDMKKFTIEGCEKYEESSSDEVSYNVEDLPDIPDFDASDESEETSVSVESEAEEVSKESDASVVSKE